MKMLNVARDRASQKARWRIEGRERHTRDNPDLVQFAGSIWKDGRTLLATSEILAERGYVTARGKPFSAAQVKRLIEAE